MSLPWVARERLEAAERFLATAHAETRRERDIADARYDVLLTRYDDLLAKFTTLRVQGAVAESSPLSVDSTAQFAPKEPDELKTLIHETCGSDYRRRAMMLRQLAADRASKASTDAIRAAILNGYSSDGVPA